MNDLDKIINIYTEQIRKIVESGVQGKKATVHLPNGLTFKEALTAYISQTTGDAILKELKRAWNATQPDTVPSGWKPETKEGKYLQKRLAALQKELHDS